MTHSGGFGQSFPPKTIAIVGVSRDDNSQIPGYTGAKLLRVLNEAGFLGRLYPINPKAASIQGFEAYPNVQAVPENVDMVIITVPAAAVPGVLEDCVTANALNVQICTSGFGETGQAEGRELENKIREIALSGGLRIVGPNCMGFQVPSARMKMFDDVQLAEGPVAFVSQSGGHARLFLLHGPEYGIGFSKVISFGNALLTDANDFLEYLADDPETEIICMYLEGIKDGGRFTRLVRQVNQTKPVIIWKGGLTTSGARAASSHTGSLGGDRQLWEAFFKQTGAAQVNSLAEMMDLASTMIHLRPTASIRSAVLVAGGGTSVATGDVCAVEGLELPTLSQSTKEGISEFVSLVNQGVSNPLDIPGVIVNAPTLERMFHLLADDPVVDIILLHLGAEFFMGSTLGVFGNEQILSFVRDRDRGPQVVVAISNEGRVRDSEKPARDLREAGVMAYSSLPSACRALRRFAEYHRFAATG